MAEDAPAPTMQDSPIEATRRGGIASERRYLKLLAIAAVAIILAHLFDSFAFRYVRWEDVYGEDWARMLRVMGFFPLWLCAAIALGLHDRTPWRKVVRARAGLLVLGAGLGGVAAELLKLVIRRGRPGDLGEYVFRSFADRPFSTASFGMPSSHALVAFGAAAVLSRMFPRAWPIWWGLAWGCGITRVGAGAHFLSDVVVAAVVGWAVGAVVWSWRERPAPVPVDVPDAQAVAEVGA
ncbi:MAG TPA: phosphatase PAP2 family protein [Longimicrobiales bacterium]|nr:phosphatase PAP2 family protein [Longimicrobiales bacterium]